MTTTERKLMEWGCPELPGRSDLVKVLNMSKATISNMASTGRKGFPRMACHGHFERSAIARFLDTPENRKYARFLTEIKPSVNPN